MFYKAVVCVVAVCGCATAARVAPESPVAPAKPVPAFRVATPTGPSTIRLEAGRDYEVRELEFERPVGTPPKDLRILVFNPKDEQSSAMVGIGADGHRKTEAAIAKYYGGATVTRVPGTIAGRPVEWWHYRDELHLYSTCYTSFETKRG